MWTVAQIACWVMLPGRDLIGVQNLMKKHQALLAELAGHEPRIGTVCGQGEQMVKEGHFAGDDITNKIRELQDKWNSLKVITLAEEVMFLPVFVCLSVSNITQKVMDRSF